MRRSLIPMVLFCSACAMAVLFSCGGSGSKDGLFVAVGGDAILVSDDGDTWTEADSLPSFSAGLEEVAYDGSGLWVTVGGSAGRVMHISSDGRNWINPTSTDTFNDLDAVAYGNGTWVAGGLDIIYSDDGDTWAIASTVPPEFGTVFGLEFDGTTWIAVGTGDEYVINSGDGNTWAVAATITSGSGYLYNVAYGNALWVATGAGNEIFNSSDGDTWSPVNSVPNVTDTVDSAFYTDGKWIAVAEDGVIFSSTDGDNWTTVNSAVAGIQRFSDVVYGDGTWVAVGGDTAGSSQAVIYTSDDGETWSPAASLPSGIAELMGVAFGN